MVGYAFAAVVEILRLDGSRHGLGETSERRFAVNDLDGARVGGRRVANVIGRAGGEQVIACGDVRPGDGVWRIGGGPDDEPAGKEIDAVNRAIQVRGIGTDGY